MKIACATDNKIHFTKNHFGDALEYVIFDLDDHTIKEINTIKNTSEEDHEIHGHKKKAKAILDLFKTEGVDILINKAFGPNIKVINKSVLPLISDTNNIEETLLFIQQNYEKINHILDTKNNVYLSIRNSALKVIEAK